MKCTLGALSGAALVLLGCGHASPPAPPPPPMVARPAPTVPAASAGGERAVDTLHRALPPVEAFQRGMIALHDAGVDRFAALHPEADGRGVLVAILDSGIDPSVPGLMLGSDGEPRILDLRDFSHEGRIALQPVKRSGDSLWIGSHLLRGAGTVAALSGNGTIWGGTLAELSLGTAPAADLNGNGSITDSLPVVVVKGPAGWAMYADLHGDGTLQDDKPIYDFMVAHQAFGWSAPGAVPPLHLAANLADSAGAPQLDLFFDTSSHGTHVSGIAAGHGLYGIRGFDGVAPGARLIGLKIANDAGGGVTVTGSMLRALDYAIRFASERHLPLVVNLSFGVGNEIEGTARIDALIDSVLAVHPDVVMAVAASNDGPALSTLGFPGSAARIISVGATQPLAFTNVPSTDTTPAPIAPFSARGFEFAAPDIAVPGEAYSTVPNWAAGQEDESGTSMAAPYASGLAARLLSAAVTAHHAVTAAMVRQALRVAARIPSGSTMLDAGAGTPDLEAAWKWLLAQHTLPVLAVDVGEVRGRAAVGLTAPEGTRGSRTPTLGASVTIRRLDGSGSLVLSTRTSASWIHVPQTIALVGGSARFSVTATADAWGRPGVRAGWVSLEGPDEGAGPLALIPVTVITPLPSSPRTVSDSLTLAAGATGRAWIAADSGRGLQIEVAASRPGAQVMASLAEPRGMPFRDGSMMPAGVGDGAALFDISADDVESGLYEVDANTGPATSESAVITARRAPVRLGARLASDTLRVSATSLVSTTASIRLRAGLLGAERRIRIERPDDHPYRLTIAVPAWAGRVLIDSRMARDAWSRFTDFGVTLLTRDGHQLLDSPLNYAFGRATTELPATLAGDSLVVLLAPGFADPAGAHDWSLDLAVRFYVDKPYALDDGGSPFRPLAGGSAREERFAAAKMPIPIPVGFDPLVLIVALEGQDHIWTRQVALRGAVGGGQ